MSINERARDMGVEELVNEIKNLKKNNDKLNNQLRKVKKEARKLGVENKKLKEGLKIVAEKCSGVECDKDITMIIHNGVCVWRL